MDDKAQVPLGLTAASKQSPIIMSMDYKVRLPDHDFTIGQGQKLIPSVYAKCEIKPTGVMSYSGKTDIFVRSAKHDGSNAFTHNSDVTEILKDEEWKTGSEVKPILSTIF